MITGPRILLLMMRVLPLSRRGLLLQIDYPPYIVSRCDVIQNQSIASNKSVGFPVSFHQPVISVYPIFSRAQSGVCAHRIFPTRRVHSAWGFWLLRKCDDHTDKFQQQHNCSSAVSVSLPPEQFSITDIGNKSFRSLLLIRSDNNYIRSFQIHPRIFLHRQQAYCREVKKWTCRLQ